MIENNKFMSISRCLSPPTENPTEMIYVGKPKELNEILEILGDYETARKYYYTISELKLKKDENNSCALHILNRVMTYTEIEQGYCHEGSGFSSSWIDLNDEVKKSLIKLLQQ